MEDATRKQIVKRLTDLGPQVDDPDQVDATLAKALTDKDAAERGALVAAVRDGVPQALRADLGYMPTNRAVLVAQLCDHAGLDPQTARWAVETLTLVVVGPHAISTTQTSSAGPPVATAPELVPALGDNIFGWYVEALSRYFDFGGRARRKEYWSFTLIYVVIFVLLEIAVGIPLGLRRSSSLDLSGARVIEAIYLLAMFCPSLSVAVRRLHDVDKSGWYLLWSFVPIIGPIVLIIAYVTEGQRWQNQYGPDPKGSVGPLGLWP